MSTPVQGGFAAVLRRMFHRDGVDSLPQHLRDAHEVVVEQVRQLDVGSCVDHPDGPPVVVRLFSATRPLGQRLTIWDVLRYLAWVAFPAKRPFARAPVSDDQGQSVRFVRLRPAH